MCVVWLFALACSTPDDCQRAVAKLRPFLELRARHHGELPPDQAMPEADKDKASEKLVEQCRDKLKEDPANPRMKCLLDAITDDAVRTCLGNDAWWALPQPS